MVVDLEYDSLEQIRGIAVVVDLEFAVSYWIYAVLGKRTGAQSFKNGLVPVIVEPHAFLQPRVFLRDRAFSCFWHRFVPAEGWLERAKLSWRERARPGEDHEMHE